MQSIRDVATTHASCDHLTQEFHHGRYVGSKLIENTNEQRASPHAMRASQSERCANHPYSVLQKFGR